MDSFVGELVEIVDAHSPERGTIILLTSDHGESVGEAGEYFTHGSNTLPPQAHVPMILRAPDLPPGRFDAIVSHVDIMPTLLELAGLPQPEGLTGIALGPLVRDGRSPAERLVVSDLGIELSLYRDDHILRAWRRGAVWNIEADTEPEPLRWTHYVWRDGAYAARGALDESDRDRIRGYLDAEVESVRGPDVNAELFEKLRVLGYVSSEEVPAEE
jgi:arylsulfatase A-like enzyme